MLTLTSCSTTKTSTEVSTTATTATPPASRETRVASLNQIKSWNLNGKIAVQSRNDSGSATVDWMQRSRQYFISLQGPLGSHAMKLSGGPGQVTLQTSDGKSYRSSSAEQLLAKQWGFHLPVSSMNYWIRGLAVPGIPANTRYDRTGRLGTLIQQGYRIDYLSYTNTGRGELPDRLAIYSPSLRVKLIVYHWTVG